jgi:hypothetical protein
VHRPTIPTYALRYLESHDGLEWGPQGEACLTPRGDEIGFGRPFVLERGNGGLQMWYSIRTRKNRYRIGYAESPDGLSWERRDDRAGIDASESGWDSEMVALASLQETRYGTYLFYNGNNFGETGFGAALLSAD